MRGYEIRTPLNGILGFAELLRRGVGTDAERKTHLETIRSSGQHLLSLINDVLDLTKIEAGHMGYDRIRCSPQQVITEVLSMLRVAAQQKGLALECRWTSGVPETILTDPARLKQLLVNLVGNAIKFTEQGGITLLASVTLDAAKPRLIIEVRDTGIGIPPDRIEAIFTAFEQADNSITRRFGGTGLGLAICRNLAKGLGGEIGVESEPGGGSTFRLTVETGPLAGVRTFAAPQTDALTTRCASAPKAVCRMSSPRVLLVEDGETNRQLIRLVLRESGVDVVCADNGQVGLELAGREQFDLILMDMQMPVMDGYTATLRLRDGGCIVPIIALTAHAMNGDREKCLAAGCSDYLAKPIDIDELLRTVADALGSRLPADFCSHAEASAGAEETLSSTAKAAGKSAITSTLPIESTLYRQLVEMFVERLHNQFDAMRAAQATADLDELAELAHWLKGAGGTVGFDCFTEPADRLNRLARQRCLEGIDPCMQELAALTQRISVLA